MKKLLLFSILLFGVISCSTSQKVLDPNTGQQVKVFRNKEFNFLYPLSWMKFTNSVTDGAVVEIAPKNSIQNGIDIFNYQVLSTSTNQYSYSYLAIYKDNINVSFDEWIQKKKESAEKKFVLFELLKNNDFSYTFITNTITEKESNVLKQSFFLHYIYHNGYVYEFNFVFIPEEYDKIKSDIEYIQNSFQFNENHTPTEFPPLP